MYLTGDWVQYIVDEPDMPHIGKIETSRMLNKGTEKQVLMYGIRDEELGLIWRYEDELGDAPPPHIDGQERNYGVQNRIETLEMDLRLAGEEIARLTAENRALQALVDEALTIVEPQSRKSPKDYAYIDYGEGRIELAKEIRKVLEGK